jgi:hypothetical protein
MSQLEPCPACHRHVAIDEPACPFCAAPLPESFRRTQRTPLRGRLTRAGLLAAGATATLLSCWSGASAYGTAVIYDAGSISDGAGGQGAAGSDGGAGVGGGGAGGRGTAGGRGSAGAP